MLPFEALYQDGLNAITADTRGFTEVALPLGPFGGAQAAGPFLWPWTLAYLALVGVTRSPRSRGRISSGRTERRRA